jgi:hypothetical protein
VRQRGSERVPKLARAVLDHFVKNPKLIEGLDGMARWRLRQATVHHTVGEVAAALQWLARGGFLKRSRHRAPRRTHQLNKEETASARRFLRSANGAAARRRSVKKRKVVAGSAAKPEFQPHSTPERRRGRETHCFGSSRTRLPLPRGSAAHQLRATRRPFRGPAQSS